MSNINLAKKMQSLSIGRKLDAFTGVLIYVGQDGEGNDISYFAGDETGYVLEATNPNGTQAMADNILASLKLRGVRYQPYEANSAMLDPAAEIGDGVTVDNTNSVILSQKTRHGRLMAADISAPYDEEVDHEFKYEPRTVREFRRESAYTRSRLTIAEDSIEAKVSKEGGNPESFGWVLTSSVHTWYANDQEVIRFNRDGAYVKGEIVATKGIIGDAEIENGHLKVNGANIHDLNADYITAGTLNVDRILAGSIGGADGNGKIAASTLSTYNTNSGINTNLGYAASYGYASSGTDPASTYYCRTIYTNYLEMYYGGRYVSIELGSGGEVRWRS